MYIGLQRPRRQLVWAVQTYFVHQSPIPLVTLCFGPQKEALGLQPPHRSASADGHRAGVCRRPTLQPTHAMASCNPPGRQPG